MVLSPKKTIKTFTTIIYNSSIDMALAQSSRSMTTHYLYDELEMHMKAMRMEFILVILGLVVAIQENNNRM